MAQILNPKEHLTSDAFRLLIAGSLPEEDRLLAAEHLSRCDRCLDRYLEALDGISLCRPETPAAPAVLRRLRRSAVRASAGRYMTFAVAAALTLILWSAGAFTKAPFARLAELPGKALPALSVSRRVMAAAEGAIEKLCYIFDRSDVGEEPVK